MTGRLGVSPQVQVSSSSWARIRFPRPTARIRLICLPFAGGTANSYWEWPAHFPQDVEVVPIQLPGRADRLGEPVIDSADLLAERLLDGLRCHLDRPFAVFGHSMGALIGFELIRRLRAIGLEPVHFFASGCPAPHLPKDPSRHRHHLPNQEFITAVRELNGVPDEVLMNEDLMNLTLPALRGDFKLVETYRYRPQAPLSCPLFAFGGLSDKEVRRDEVEAWSRHTIGPFHVSTLSGDHFFPNSNRLRLLRLISEELGKSSL